jgi:putative transposase
MRVFKSISAIDVNRLLDRQGRPLWQRNYYERVIRDERELAAARRYIVENPIKWADDDENPGQS